MLDQRHLLACLGLYAGLLYGALTAAEAVAPAAPPAAAPAPAPAPAAPAPDATDETAPAAPTAEWVPLANLRKPQGNLSLTARWLPDEGLRFLIQQKDTNNQVVLEFSANDLRAFRRTPGNPPQDDAIEPVFRRLENAPREPSRRASVLLKFRDNDWQVYVQDRLLGRIPSPFAPPATVLAPPAQARYVDESRRFQPVEDERFESDFMVEPGAPHPLYPWQPVGGDWQLHTAQEDALVRPESNVERIKQVPLTADKSPNFFCVKAKGPGAVMTVGYDFQDDYEYSAAVQANEGEAGLIFYHRNATHYYAFTLAIRPPPDEGGTLRLWRVGNGQRTVLAEVAAELLINQWYSLRVEAGNERIRCFLDNVEVASVREALPAGGKVGLCVDTPTEARFDDAKLVSIRALFLGDVEHIRFYTLAHEGTFYRNPGLFTAGTPPQQPELRPSRSWQDQQLILGRPTHRCPVFSAEFAPTGTSGYTIGLAAGYVDAERPYYRFEYERTPTAEGFRLVRVRHGRGKELEGWRQDRSAEGVDKPVRLMADPSTPGELRLYRDGQLVLVHAVTEPVTGAAGLFLGAGTRAVIRGLDYRFERADDYKEQVQENQVFRNDPFMRHWASPEGQWVAGEPAGSYWHKSDFFGRLDVHVPAVPGSELHVGVLEDATNGYAAVSIGEGKLVLRVGESLASPAATLEAPLKAPEGKTQAALSYAVSAEGYWLCVTVEGTQVLKYRLREPLRGTRVRAAGLTTEHLATSLVNRYLVKDELFTAAPTDWIVNGGTWAVVNRFQCTPSWSHMSGESASGMAAIWHKYQYRGDFTLEFYAGIRHGWYQRPGDLNCTAMAATTAPDTGYTVTCTEWDENHSENWSTFFRRGQVIDRSDHYLVPRRRKGYEWRTKDPLVAEGRPIHGAWYYIKLRRIGSKLEYYFDNERVFVYTDADPIPSGLMGIWTFMNSMTVARIKVSFREIEPRPFAFRALTLRGGRPATPVAAPPVAAAPAAVAPPPAAATPLQVTQNGCPLDSLAPALWTVSDDVGHARLTHGRMNASTVTLTNRLGSGAMFLQAGLPPLPLSQVAGWRFLLKRTHGQKLDFHYTFGTVDANGTYTPTRNFFHHVNGSDFSEGGYTLTGHTAVPGSASLDARGSGWSLVRVWIPSRFRSGPEADKTVFVRVEGFGHRQPTYIMGGIGGAKPGDGFAVNEFTPVFYGAPKLAVPAGVPAPSGYALCEEAGGRVLLATDALPKVEEYLGRCGQPGLNLLWLQVRDGGATGFSHSLAWLQLPDKVEYSFGWHPDAPAAVQVRTTLGYPDPRFALASISLGQTALALTADNDETRLAFVPRAPPFAAAAGPALTFTVNPGSGPDTVPLNWTDNHRPEAPVLLELEGLTPFLATFESRTFDARLSADPTRHALGHVDPAQGTFLTVRNRELEQRLTTPFSLGFSLARYPLLSFRYRAFDMSRLTAAFQGGYYVRLSDDLSTAVKVRLGEDLKEDQTWRTWLGFATDGFGLEPYNTARFQPTQVVLASAGTPDQTGRFSRCDLDDVVFGPAVATAAELACTPRYFDTDGVAAVWVAVSAAEAPYADLDEAARETLTWVRGEPDTQVKPSVEGLADGVHHLLVKAADAGGLTSAVTDLPFLLDTKPLTPTFAFEPMANPASNGVQMRVQFDNGGGAPWQIAAARFYLAGTESALPAWTNRYVHSPTADTLVLNYPFVFRTQLDAAKDGDTLEFAVDGIADGAGNASPRLSVPIKVDFAADKTGPAWYAFKAPPAVHWFFNWDGAYAQSLAFTPATYNQATPVHTPGESPYFQTATYYTTGDVHRDVDWKPSTHPWLSFRMRRPAVHAPTALQAALVCDNGVTYSLSLGAPGTAPTELNRTQTITWQSNQWQRLSFNVRDLLRAAGVADAALANLTVKQLFLQRRGATHAELLDLDDIFLHAANPTADDDAWTWYGYDASGVASLELAYCDDKDNVLWRESAPVAPLNLKPLRARAVGTGWLMCQAKDKAGNLSVPFWFPLPKES